MEGVLSKTQYNIIVQVQKNFLKAIAQYQHWYLWRNMAAQHGNPTMEEYYNDKCRECSQYILSENNRQNEVLSNVRDELSRRDPEEAARLTKAISDLFDSLGSQKTQEIVGYVLADRETASEEALEQNGASSPIDGSSSPVHENGAVRDHSAGSSSVVSSSGDDGVAEDLSQVEVLAQVAQPEQAVEAEQPPAELPGPQESSTAQVEFCRSLGLLSVMEHKEESKRLAIQAAAIASRGPVRLKRPNAGKTSAFKDHERLPKRKRHEYLQSLGSAPQTRQTTARLNGPSSPPSKSNSCNGSPSKSLMKHTVAKPNILRNGDGGRQKTEYLGKVSVKQEEKSVMGKTVHIPGLPSGLTIERIENDSTVCIACRNPGTLTVCEYCTAKFHVSCHTISPASSCYCPKCANRFRSKGLNSSDLEILRLEMKGVKKEKEIATAAYATRAPGRAGEDTEIHKTSGELCETDKTTTTRQQPAAILASLNQLPSSTFLIPIATSSPTIVISGGNSSATISNHVTVTPVDESLVVTSTSALGSTPTTPRLTVVPEQSQQQQSSILLSQLSQPSITSTESRSFLFVEKVSSITTPQPLGKRRWSSDRPPAIKPKPGVSVLLESAKQSGLSFTKSNNSGYVTVEVVCNNDDDDKQQRDVSENSADCVYVSEGSSGGQELAVLVPERIEEAKPTEPEVVNISSGSSGIDIIESPESPADTERLETSTDYIPNDDDDNDDNSQPQYHWEQHEYFSSVFPGSFGYKINIVERSDSESDTESQSDSERHVKLEETHLSASPTTELVSTMEIDEVANDEGNESNEGLTTVPDNKSDGGDDDDNDEDDVDAAKRDCDNEEQASRSMSPTGEPTMTD